MQPFSYCQLVELPSVALTWTVWYADVHLAIGASTSASSFFDCNACVSSSGQTNDKFIDQYGMQKVLQLADIGLSASAC